MSPSKPTSAQAGQVIENSLYDEIMGGIEPELMSESLKTLNILMADDTPEERAERTERYKNAFEEFDSQLATYEQNMNVRYLDRRKTVLQAMERQEGRTDKVTIANLEQSISDAA